MLRPYTARSRQMRIRPLFGPRNSDGSEEVLQVERELKKVVEGLRPVIARAKGPPRLGSVLKEGGAPASFRTHTRAEGALQGVPGFRSVGKGPSDPS